MSETLNSSDITLFIWQTILLIVVLLWIIALVDILRNNFKGNEKIVWLLAVIFVPLLGSLLYFAIGKRKTLKTSE